jgi:hypothetical protein
MGTKGRLRRCFPGPAITISGERIANDNFRKPFAQLVAQLDAETPLEAWRVVSKARSGAIETRDTVDPRFVTEMLMGLLRGIGQPRDVKRIWKHTRDDVLWKDALAPWRRSPLWLLLRVALQTSLISTKNKANLHGRYKSFMIFFMACILKCALQTSQPSDILFLMAAKISRRMLKLNSQENMPWSEYVHAMVEAAHRELIDRWNVVEGNLDPIRTQEGWNPHHLQFIQDSQLTLSTLRAYLGDMPARTGLTLSQRVFMPDCGPRVLQASSKLPVLNLRHAKTDEAFRLYLADIEGWVRDWLNDWLELNIHSLDSSVALAEVIEGYIAAASRVYAGVPEDFSILVLTSLDLWVALDKCAIYHYQLLGDYDHGFPQSLFDPLLLPKKSQMVQLDHIEQYLKQRRRKSKQGFSSLFQDINTKCFAARYYDQSPRHQELRQRIEAAAGSERAVKKEELAFMRRQYQDLMEQSNRASCEYVERRERRRQVSRHSSSCKKCQLKSRAQNLTITVHEWPLPDIDVEAKLAVFELDVPTAISKWRDTTYSVLVDVCTPMPSSLEKPQQAKNRDRNYPLLRYAGLSKYKSSGSGRIQLVSTAKPFIDSHYRSKKVSEATEDMMCVNNGMRYAMYDSKTDQWINKLARCELREMCTYQLPAGSYKVLQFALDDTTHTSNEVIAKQSTCARELTLHEFYSFATLRSGNRLQWRNIARELVTRVLNFNRDETHILVLQTMWQGGPSIVDKTCRESHVDLDEEEFGLSLLSALEEIITSIEGNWQAIVAVRTLIAVATRLLSVSSHPAVHQGCYRYLRCARQVTLTWTRALTQLLHDGKNSDHLEGLNIRVLEVALTCHGTYDVEAHHVPGLLTSDDDVAIVAECSIIIHDRCPAITDELPGSLITLLRRYWRVCHLLEPIIRKQILARCNAINIAIHKLWAGYRPGRDWIALKSPNERWLMTKTSDKGDHRSVVVQYNTLDGSLLVNGSALSRLPQLYELHETYYRLFKEVQEFLPRGINELTCYC